MLDWNSFGWNPFNAEWTRHQDILIDRPSVVTWLWHWTGPACSWRIYIYGELALQVGRGLEYLHRSLASRKRRCKGNPVPEGKLGHPVPGVYKYGNLALHVGRVSSEGGPGSRNYVYIPQVGGVSDETVKYGYRFWATRTIEWLHCKLHTRPLVREGASQKQDRKFQTATFRQGVVSGRKSHKGARYQDILTNHQS
jgi:hypothetical protein